MKIHPESGDQEDVFLMVFTFLGKGGQIPFYDGGERGRDIPGQSGSAWDLSPGRVNIFPPQKFIFSSNSTHQGENLVSYSGIALVYKGTKINAHARPHAASSHPPSPELPTHVEESVPLPGSSPILRAPPRVSGSAHALCLIQKTNSAPGRSRLVLTGG